MTARSICKVVFRRSSQTTPDLWRTRKNDERGTATWVAALSQKCTNAGKWRHNANSSSSDEVGFWAVNRNVGGSNPPRGSNCLVTQ